jgi:tRNA A58 N-methylase Trm61
MGRLKDIMVATNIITEWNRHSSGFVYRNVIMYQNPSVQVVFSHFFREHSSVITRIIEFGTGHGGLALLLSDCTGPGVDIFSYDVVDYADENSLARVVTAHKVIRKLKNVFLPETILEIKELIDSNSTGRTLLVCDGGDKINEFNTFSNFLRSGDFIMAHDFARTRDAFAHTMLNKRWNRCNIVEADIHASCLQHNLQDYFQPAFWESAYTCKIKI